MSNHSVAHVSDWLRFSPHNPLASALLAGLDAGASALSLALALIDAQIGLLSPDWAFELVRSGLVRSRKDGLKSVYLLWVWDRLCPYDLARGYAPHERSFARPDRSLAWGRGPAPWREGWDWLGWSWSTRPDPPGGVAAHTALTEVQP